jgi:gliding motility-associated-like protein
MTFVDALKTTEISSKKATPDYCNYFIGNDKSKWAGNVKNYKEVNYKGLYNHVNLEIVGLQNSVKYNFYVSPQGNTNQIQLFYEGLNSISLEKGALKLTTSVNELYEQHPYAYQWIGNKRVDVPCEFVLENTTVHFKFSQGYNKNFELVIDPVLVFAASSGSVADNFGHTATYDEQGNLYSGGTAYSQGYPTKLGAYDNTYNGIIEKGRTDVVITKYDASGTFLQYSTYLGGLVSTEIPTSLIVDAQNNLYLYGVTGSSDFPVTANGYDLTFNGGINYIPHPNNGNYYNSGTDIYVAKFSNTGSTLLASTFIGGSNNDGINSNDNVSLFWGGYPLDSLQYNYGDYYRGEIDIDKVGNVIVVTSTRSKDFPIVNGFDTTLGGTQDAVVFKMDNNLSQLLWSTFLGGSKKDCANSLAIDNLSNIYVTGGTCSNDFYTTSGALQTNYNGGKADGYIVKIKQDGSVILFSSFFGTIDYDQTYFVQLDKKLNVYLFGQTSGSMPVTPGVYSNAGGSQFITKMNNSLSSIIYSTVFGNGSKAPTISPTAFLVDNCENIYVSGWACGFNSNNKPTKSMPITANANDSSTAGFDFYLMGLTSNATSLLYATYFGGDQSAEHVHGGTSRYDKKGIVYQSLCTGCGGVDDFPGTPGAWPNNGSNWNGSNNCNNGVFKLDFQTPLAIASFTVDRLSGCAPLTVKFNNESPAGVAYKWDFGKNDTTSVIRNPIKTFDSVGTYQVKLCINNPLTCNVTDTVLKLITVYPLYKADFDFTNQHCTNLFTFHDSSALAPVSWLWYFDDGDSSTVQNPQHIYDSIGKYNVQQISTTINGCKDTAIVQVDNTTATASISSRATICKNDTVQLFASRGVAYQWTPSASINNSTIANPIANPDTTTTYTVIITSVNTIGDTCHKTLTTQVKVVDPTLYSIAAIADKDTIFKGESTMIHAITDTTLKVTWALPNTFGSPNNFTQLVSPEQTTTYTVSILGAIGCEKSTNITIFVISKECDAANIFVPNTFTPNGDGKNDILFVRGNEINELYFAVYNRWGQIVFETNSMNKGWDGNYNNMKTDPAVFAWYVRAKCYNGDTLEKKGNITLIR